MHLIGNFASPFVQRALMAARFKGAELDVAPPPGGSLQSPAFQAISPMGRIPVLVLDDGRHLCESGAIAAYLDEVLPGPALLPADRVSRARVRELEAIAGLEFGAGMRPVMVGPVFGMPQSPDILAAARAQLEKGLDVLDRLLDGAGSHAVGDAATLADCVLVPTLHLAEVVDARAGTAAAIAARPRVRRYLDAVAADPVAARTTAEMDAGFAAIMARNAAN